MQAPVKRLWGVALVWALCTVAPGLAQSDALKAAVDLYDQQEYAAAQEAFLKVDRNQLSEVEKAELDAYLRELPEAIKSAARSRQDLEQADAAFAEGRWDEAERLYRAVMVNKYSRTASRDAASRKLAQVDEKRKLAEAIRPGGEAPKPAADAPQPAEPRPAAPQPAAAEPTDGQAPAAQVQAQPPAEEAPLDDQRMTLTDQMRLRDSLLWQKAEAQMHAAINQARQAVAAQNFEEARRSAQAAMQFIESARVYAQPPSKYQAARVLAEQIKQEVDDADREFQMERARREREEIARRQKLRTELERQKRDETIEQLFNSAAQLRKEQRFREAAEMLRQVLYLDPSNTKARYQLEVVEDYQSLHDQRQLARDFQYNMRETFVDAEETKIPWATEVLYPRNWRELVVRREEAGVGVSGETDESRELNRKLEEKIPETSFQDQPLEGIIEFLTELKQVNIAVDWEDLEANGIERDKPISLRLNNLSFRTVLSEILTQAGGEVRLGFTVAGGLFKIATKEKLDRAKEIRVYDINDLLVDIPRFTNAAQLNPGQALNQLNQGGFGGGGGGGGGSGQLFEDEDQDDQRDDEAGGRGALVEEIMNIIRSSVETDSWRETGGGDASILELNGQLIIYNTSDAHRQVSDLLSQLRAFRALQIAIETRFLTVGNNFLEEIGVDLDFVFNSGSAGFDQAFTGGGVPIVDPFTGGAVLVPRAYTDIGGLPNVPAFPIQFTNPGTGGAVGAAPTGIGQPWRHPGLVPQGTGIPPHFDDFTPIRAAQNSLNLVNPANFRTGVPGSFADAIGAGAQPALSVAGSFLDNLQVDFLIRATQANARSSVVQAPRLILFNGQRSNIFVGRSQTYVASLQPQIAQQAVAFAPQIGVAQSGSSLDVEATISADRKYVTVTVQTQRAQDPVLTRFEVQRASGNAPGAFITTVDQQSASVNTTVSIPDGGTVLLGGLKLVGEFEVEAGVPILSKIPVLKRAFTNTTTIKDTQTLLILMKAKIIIQSEAEQEAFPMMSSAGG